MLLRNGAGTPTKSHVLDTPLINVVIQPAFPAYMHPLDSCRPPTLRGLLMFRSFIFQYNLLGVLRSNISRESDGA